MRGTTNSAVHWQLKGLSWSPAASQSAVDATKRSESPTTASYPVVRPQSQRVVYACVVWASDGRRALVHVLQRCCTGLLSFEVNGVLRYAAMRPLIIQCVPKAWSISKALISRHRRTWSCPNPTGRICRITLAQCLRKSFIFECGLTDTLSYFVSASSSSRTPVSTNTPPTPARRPAD